MNVVHPMPVRALIGLLALVLAVSPMPGGTSRALLQGRARHAVGTHAPDGTGDVRWSVRGRVEDATHQPLAGAVVRVLLATSGRTFPLGRVSAGADGRFVIPDVGEGSYWVVATAPGFVRETATVRVRGGDPAPMTLSLAPGHRLAGMLQTVTDHGPEGFAGAVVRALREGAVDEPGFAVRAAADGAFVFDNLPRGTYRIDVAEAGYESVRRPGIMAPSTGLSLLVRALATVEGVVRNASGEGERGATVVIAGSGLWPARRVDVLEDGRFLIAGLPAGVYEVRASAGDDVAEPVAPLMLDPGDRREVTLTLGRGATLHGTVVDAESRRPIAGARVVIVEDALSTAPRAITSDANGGFRVTGLLRRSHQVSARADGYAPRTGLTAAPGEAALSVVLERAATVVGRVVDARGEPVAHAQIEATVRDADGRPTWLTGASVAFRESLFAAQARGPSPLLPAGELGVTRGRVPIVPIVPLPQGITAERAAPGFVTDGDGRFEITDVPPGVMTLATTHPLYVRGESDPRLLRAGERAEMNVTLYAGATLEGRVVTERGFPVGGAQVEVRSASDVVARRVWSERDGTFRVPTVLGHVALVAFMGTRVGARAELDVVDGTVVPVTLTLPGSLRRVEGRVVDTRGFPVEGATIVLTSLERASLGAATTLTEHDGTFDTVMGGAGGLQVSVRHPAFAPFQTRVDDLTRPLRFELTEGASLTFTPHGDGCATGPGRAEVRTPCGPMDAPVLDRDETHIERLCSGRATLVLEMPGCIRTERTVTLGGANTDLGRIELSSGGGVEGEVLDARGEAVSGALVRRDGAPEEATTGTARSDRQGAFSVTNLPDGEIALVAVHPTLGRSLPTSVRIIRATVAHAVRIRFEREIASATVAAAPSAVTVVTTRVGVEVRGVTEGSAAAAAGLRAGDVVVSVGATAVTRAEQVERALRGGPTDDVVLEVERDGVRRTVRFRRGI